MKKTHSKRFVNQFSSLMFLLLLSSVITACAPEEDTGGPGPQFLFFADNGPQGREPWVSNGTAAGTKGIKDLALNSLDSVTGSGLMGGTKIVYMGSKAYFAANDGSGEELWVSDATPGGTKKIADINLTAGSEPKYITVFNGWLYFSATDGSGRELWRSDGTVGGTTEKAADINGTAGSDPKYLTVMDGVLYFSADDGTNGRELWSHNGTLDNATIVDDINPTTGSSDPKYLTVLDKKLYFSATDGANGRELWCYGCGVTPAVPVMIKNINSVAADSIPEYLTSFNGKLYFSATDGVNGIELWVSTGELNNAERVDSTNSAGLKKPNSMIEFNSALYFGGSDASGVDLWKYTGTGVPQKIQDIETGNTNTTVADMKVFQGRLYFVADHTANGLELWVSNGSSASLFKDINGGAGHAFEIID